MASFTFLHAADLHLDSPLRGLTAYEGAPLERLRSATRAAFENLVERALEERVAFVVLAGDLFDGEWPDAHSGLWLANRLRRLTEAGVRVLQVHGNHDVQSRLTKRRLWPEGVTTFGSGAPETERFDELEVAVHGWSYDEQHVRDNPVPRYPEPVPGCLNVGVLHTGLTGYDGHGHYAPCTVADLAAKGYDYWALGHVHAREEVSREPWIVFPGNLQGRHVRETGAKGMTRVSVEDGRVVHVEHVPCDVVRWHVLDVELGGVDDRDRALSRAREQLAQAVADSDGRLAAVRVVLRGATALDDELRLTQAQLREELRAAALDVSAELWLEKLRVETAPLRAEEARDGLGALAARLRTATLAAEECAALADELAPLARRLPPSVAEELRLVEPETVAAAADPARRYLAALLSEREHPADDPQGEEGGEGDA